MSNKLSLIDFGADLVSSFKERFKSGVYTYTTAWQSDRVRHLDIDNEQQIFFYDAQYTNRSTGSLAHIDDGKKIRQLVQEGSIMVIFTGNCSQFHIENLMGTKGLLNVNQEIAARGYERTSIALSVESPFSKIFSQFGNYILNCATLLTSMPKERHNPLDLNFIGLQVLARHKSTHTAVSLYIKQKDALGFYLILPRFGIRAAEIAQLLVDDILPDIAPYMFYDEKGLWLDDEQYYMPSVNVLIEQRNKLISEHENNLEKINEKLDAVKKVEQDIFNQILITKADNLKNAVKSTFEYLGWHVVDVDALFVVKKRDLEEDLWLFEKKNYDLKKDKFILVEVKGDIRRPANDNDCQVILKYLSRRIGEVGHMNVKGLLVFNHYYGKPAHDRESAFREQQINDATRTKYALISTYNLFMLVKAEKEGRISLAEIKNAINTMVGEITVDRVLDREKS